MKNPLATSRLDLEIAKMARSCTPIPDRTYVMGMIEMVEFAELIPRHEANTYRDRLDLKFCKRNDHLKRVSA